MAIITCLKRKDTFLLTFGNDTSIRNITRIRNGLKRVIDYPASKFRIDLSGVENTDITFVQLLISLNERLKRDNRAMTLSPLPENSPFLSTASKCGVNAGVIFNIEEDGGGDR